jgi:hypothetical protein
VALLLLAAGALFGLLYILIGLVRAIRGSERIGFLDTLLVFLTTLLLLGALINNRMEEQPLQIVEGAVIGMAGVVFVLSLIIALIEYRRPQHLRQSRGVFGMGAAILVLISTFSVPFVSDYFAASLVTPTAASPVATEEVESGMRASTSTAQPTTAVSTTQPSNTPMAAPSSTPTLPPTPTETRLPTEAPTLTPTLVNCQIIADYNVNLRTAPESSGELVATIPFNTIVTGLARNADATWWLVSYEEQLGWLDNEFVTAGFLCENLPVR